MRSLFLITGPIVRDAHLRAKEEMHAIIARRHGFDPKLEDDIRRWDTIENSIRVAKIFRCDGLVPGRRRSRDA